MFKIKQGFTLLEALISLVLLSFVLLQFDGMQVVALKQTEANYFFQIANNEFDAMYERLFALQNNNGLTQQIAEWQKQIKQELPGAVGEVTGRFPHYKISILYQGSKCVSNEFQFQD